MNESLLMKDLIWKNEYDYLVPPIVSDSLLVFIDVTDVIINHQPNPDDYVAKVSAYLGLAWLDKRVQWDPAQYGDINLIRIPASILWIPDIRLYNSHGQEDFLKTKEYNAVVASNGHLYYVPVVDLDLVCDKMFKNMRRGEANSCSVILGPWTLNSKNITLLKDLTYSNQTIITKPLEYSYDVVAETNIGSYTYPVEPEPETYGHLKLTLNYTLRNIN